MARRRRNTKRRSGFPVFELAVLCGLVAAFAPNLLGMFVAIVGLVVVILALFSGFGSYVTRGLDALLPDAPAQKDYRRQQHAAIERDFYPEWRGATNDTRISRPASWSLEVLRSLEWRRFEELVEAYFRVRGYTAKMTSIGADGGVDIVVASSQENEPLCLVQCKAWNSWQVGVKPVRELLGVMSSQGVKLGAFMTTSEFSRDAQEFAAANNIKLVDGRQFLEDIGKLPPEQQQELLQLATQGDYTTPTCPRCDVKMVWRDNGSYRPFWGCANYPRCKQKLYSAGQSEAA